MATKKDYQLVAAAIAESKSWLREHVKEVLKKERKTYEEIASTKKEWSATYEVDARTAKKINKIVEWTIESTLIAHFKADNSRFDSKLFKEACAAFQEQLRVKQ